MLKISIKRSGGQAKFLDVFSNDIMRKGKKRLKFFSFW